MVIFLPFGSGVVTVAERGNNHLRLWSIKDNPAPTIPIHAYVGHKYPDNATKKTTIV